MEEHDSYYSDFQAKEEGLDLIRKISNSAIDTKGKYVSNLTQKSKNSQKNEEFVSRERGAQRRQSFINMSKMSSNGSLNDEREKQIALQDFKILKNCDLLSASEQEDLNKSHNSNNLYKANMKKNAQGQGFIEQKGYTVEAIGGKMVTTYTDNKLTNFKLDLKNIGVNNEDQVLHQYLNSRTNPSELKTSENTEKQFRGISGQISSRDTNRINSDKLMNDFSTISNKNKYKQQEIEELEQSKLISETRHNVIENKPKNQTLEEKIAAMYMIRRDTQKKNQSRGLVNIMNDDGAYEDNDENIDIGSTSSRRLINFENEKKRLEQLSTERKWSKKLKIPGQRMKERAEHRINRSQQNTPDMSKYSKKSKMSRAESYNSLGRSAGKSGAKIMDLGQMNKTFNHIGQYQFKNEIAHNTKVKVGLDMLHTDELMEYYKDVISKGKKDFVQHHRQQNLIKKLEYN